MSKPDSQTRSFMNRWDRFTLWLARKHLIRVQVYLLNESMKNKDKIGKNTTMLEDNRLAGASLALSGAAGWVMRYRRNT